MTGLTASLEKENKVIAGKLGSHDIYLCYFVLQELEPMTFYLLLSKVTKSGRNRILIKLAPRSYYILGNI